MSEPSKPFVVTDRRKFTVDGDPRPDADPSPEKEKRQPVPVEIPSNASSAPASHPPASLQTNGRETNLPGKLNLSGEIDPPAESELPPAPTEDQAEQSRLAYEMTADRIETAIRSANPGMDHPPPMNFEQLTQSIYMTAIMQLGGATPAGQQPQVDIMGARQSVDMLGVLVSKTKGNLSPDEIRLLDSALFELRMAFLEITQALARSAAQKAPGPGGRGFGPGGGPSIVR